jgi:23S rRNA pseudouridine955/2504/2580 synthase
LIALDKPAGLAVHGGSGISFGVIEAIRRARPCRALLELVHRLDRDTSGVLLIAQRNVRRSWACTRTARRRDRQALRCAGPGQMARRVRKVELPADP